MPHRKTKRDRVTEVMVKSILSLSSGTLSVMTGLRNYDDIDEFRDAVVAYVRNRNNRKGEMWTAILKEFIELSGISPQKKEADVFDKISA